MGLFDLFRRSPKPQPRPEPEIDNGAGNRRFNRDGLFDVDKTAELAQLFAVRRDLRDAHWQARFWDAAWSASVQVPATDAYPGPDGFLYLRLDIPRPGPFDSHALGGVARDCLKAGVGAAFFSSPDDTPGAAQYVLPLGTIDSLVRYDSPDGDPVDVAEAAPNAEADFDFTQPLGEQQMRGDAPRQVLVGTPSREYLPPHIAAALCRHLEQAWGLRDPRVQLLVDMSLRPHRHLVIGRKRSEFAPGAPVDDMARALLWFLTPGRSIVLMPEDWRLRSMTPLRQLC